MATALHLLVDGLCVCCLYLMVQPVNVDDLVSLFLTYNLLAFTTQPLTGWWTDRLRKLHWALLLSVGLLSTAVVLLVSTQWLHSSLLYYWLVAVLLGMGNSFFHVWGGKLTVLVAGNDMRALGIFVSTGAVGLVVGVICASWWLAAGMLTLIALIASFAIRIPITCDRQASDASNDSCDSRRPCQHPAYLWLVPILLFVLVRSFLGETLPSNLEKDSSVLLLLATTAMVGKAGGGWVARQWGVGTSIVACVGVAVACMLWSLAGNSLWPVLIGVLFINFTMPMTLYLANCVLPRREGLAFGLLAAVLIPGYMLAHNDSIPFMAYFMLAALLLTIAIELGMLRLMGERQRKVYIGCVILNILTNVPLNFVLLTVGSTTTGLIIGELLVLLVEAIGYFILIRNWKRAAIYSLLCNATSFLVGILIQLLI